LKINNNISTYFKLIDKPNKRKNKKLHKKPTPITGGVFLFFIIIIISILNLNSFGIISSLYYLFFFASIFFIGILDDKYDIDPIIRIFYKIFVISIFISFDNDLIITELRTSLIDSNYNINNFFFTTMCILALMITFNMMDGIDGIVLLVFLTLIILITIFMGKYLFANYALLIFATGLLLIANLKRLLFLGSSGNQILGLFVALMLIKNYNKNINVMAEDIILLLLIPHIDLIRLLITRSLKGKSPLDSDNNHFHHIILKLFKKNYFVFLYYLITIIIPFISYKFFNLNFLYSIILSLGLYLIIILKAKKTF
jgi:UDP-GlcNAc:undecaprenyl-phosphate GlcNAc-1-phosphate transferase